MFGFYSDKGLIENCCFVSDGIFYILKGVCFGRRAVMVILFVAKLLNAKSFQMRQKKNFFRVVPVYIIYRINSRQEQNAQLILFELFFVSLKFCELTNV